MPRRTAPRLVRYVSPFGSPAWMPREQAEAHLKADDERWLLLQEVEREGAGALLTKRQHEVGPPRIEVHS